MPKLILKKKKKVGLNEEDSVSGNSIQITDPDLAQQMIALQQQKYTITERYNLEIKAINAKILEVQKAQAQKQAQAKNNQSSTTSSNTNTGEEK